MTQEQLAHAVGLTRTSITNIEKGRQKVLAHVLVQLSDALGQEVANLLPDQARAEQPLPEKGGDWIERTLQQGGDQ